MDFLSQKECQSAVNKLIKTASQMKKDAHLVACSLLHHVVTSRNITPIRQLCDAINDVSHSNAMSKWMKEYGHGPIKWDSKEKHFVVNTTVCDILAADDEAMANFDKKLAESTPYFELTKATPYRPFVLVDRMASAMLAAVKKEVEGLTEQDNIEGLDAFISALKTIDQKKGYDLDTKITALRNTVATGDKPKVTHLN